MPGPFVLRLRKFLKTRRITSVAQIGTDRIIEIQFSDGSYRLYLEFFASGNIILTDADLKILALLRNVPEGEGQEPQRIGLAYNLDNRQNFGGIPPLTEERLKNALTTSVEKAAAAETAGIKNKKKGQADLRRGLATTITELPPVLVDHVFRISGFDSKLKPAEVLEDPALFNSLFESLTKARAVVDGLTGSPVSKGYIIAKPRPGLPSAPETKADDRTEEKNKNVLYEDFHPFLPKQFEDDPAYIILPFDGFNKTVDEFFSSLEGQKLESRLNEREATAKRKLDAARRDQEKRVEGLEEVGLLNLRKAAAIEANVERVQEAMDAVNGLLEQGMDWVDVTRLIEREKKRQNPVAEIIKLPMKLEENTITLMIGEEEEEEEAETENMDFDYDTDEDVEKDEEEKPGTATKRLEVDIKLNASPWASAREYYDEKRTAAEKAEKTKQQAVLAIANAERKIADDLSKGLKQEKPVLHPIRKQMWFEKFVWFVSSDGYLVLGGRDVQQNEMLYKRYLRKGDVYVHADLHGASSVIIKNNPKTPDAPIPPSTLTQAGHLSVCSSTAWDSKAGMPAWWVRADQVSKSAPTGEYLPTGSFMIRGKKNFLPPAQLMLGFGILFRVSEDTRGKQARNRVYESATTDALDDPPDELTLESGDPETADEDGEDDQDPQRANPLQSGGPDDGHESDDDIEEKKKDGDSQDGQPPSEKLDHLELSDPIETADAKPADDPAAENEEIEDAEEEDNEEPDDDESLFGSVAPSTTAASQAGGQKKAPAKRGQRNKAKKAAKYKNQDDDDRAIMESITGVAKGRERAMAEEAAKAKRAAEIAAAQERHRVKQERTKKEIAEHEEVRRLMLEEGGEYLDQSEPMEMAPLDTLVGTPLVGDEILEAIPICAPWLAMGKIKYKAKIQPGNTKKGKAVKEIIERWRIASAKKGVVDESASDTEKIWPREAELIKALKVEESYNCVPVAKVTITMSGGAAGGGGGSSKGGGLSKGSGNAKGGGRGGKGSKKK